MDLILHVVSQTGLPKWVAQKIVNAISWGGNAMVVGSIISTIISGGALAAVEAGADLLVLRVKSYMKKHAYTWVVAY